MKNIIKSLCFFLTALLLTSSLYFNSFAVEEEPKSTEAEKGDIDGNGAVDTRDLVSLRKYFADYDYEKGEPPFELGESADINGEDGITAADLALLRKVLAEKELVESAPDTDNISAISPALGETVVLANDTVYSWYQQFDGTSKTLPAAAKADIYYPVPLSLEWSCTKDAMYYLVFISTNENMSNPLSYVTNKTSLSIENLFVGTNYYWQVDAVTEDATYRSEVFSFKTEVTPRTIAIEGVSNTRDIGGLPTADGNTIKQGMIYRGGKLENITEKGKHQFIYDFGIKTDLDLRTVGEGGAGAGGKSPVSDSLNYFIYDGRYYVGDKGISNENGKKIIADEIRVFANPDNYPVYIHCSLGRDRTGTLVMILQGLCGVEKWDIYMDYEMSMFSYGGTQDGSNPWQSIQDTYAYINNNYSGSTFAEKTENYLLSCGITAEEIATIRSMMIEEVK